MTTISLESLSNSQNSGLLDARKQDALDPLSKIGDLFDLPPNLVYLDGNSLGAMPAAVPEKIQEAVTQGWRTELIRSWNDRGWHIMPLTLGNRLAPLMGANPGEVLVVDSTSINLFKTLSAALEMRPGRTEILSEQNNFPSDLHIIQGAMKNFYPRHKLIEGKESDESILDLIGPSTAVVTLTQVSYRTGLIRDMEKITKSAQQAGALVIWDLAHTLGAIPVDLNSANVDFAVGCTYKYLNAGPGGPAYLFVANRHITDAVNPLTGWQAHADPFSFDTHFKPANNIDKFRCGTPGVLSYIALESSLDIFEIADMQAIRTKSKKLTTLFIDLVESLCNGYSLQLASPRNSDKRGSQVSFSHSDGWPIMQALIAHGVIGDFRAPNLLRFGFAPLYTRYEDVWLAASMLAHILETECWKDPLYETPKLVT